MWTQRTDALWEDFQRFLEDALDGTTVSELTHRHGDLRGLMKAYYADYAEEFRTTPDAALLPDADEEAFIYSLASVFLDGVQYREI